jgi:hypothetical protein
MSVWLILKALCKTVDIVITVGSIIVLARIQMNSGKKDLQFEIRVVEVIKPLCDNSKEELSTFYIFLGGFLGLFFSLFLFSISITLISRELDSNLVFTNSLDTKELNLWNFVDGFNLNPSKKRKGDLDPFLGFDVTSYHDVI